MCRMVGVVFRSDFPMGSLRELRHLSKIGKVPDETEPGHGDGWGMVSFMHGSPRLIGKSEREAYMDESYDAAMADVAKIDPPNVLIAHVRRASEGGRALNNTHPFISGSIVMAHNGTLRGFQPKTRRSPRGDTDSERLLMLLADRCEDAGDVELGVREVLTEDLPACNYNGAILLLSDGRRLWGYRSVRKQDWEWYYKLKIARCRDEVLLFQESVDEGAIDGEVTEVMDGELVTVDLGLSVRVEPL